MMDVRWGQATLALRPAGDRAETRTRRTGRDHLSTVRDGPGSSDTSAPSARADRSRSAGSNEPQASRTRASRPASCPADGEHDVAGSRDASETGSGGKPTVTP